MQNNCLMVKGEKKQEIEQKDANCYLSERSFGSFTRSIELPVTIDPKRVEAQFKDGVLQITMPKTEEAKPKQIDIKVN